jgi:sugar (pentulose or hexulose) kinase
MSYSAHSPSPISGEKCFSGRHPAGTEQNVAPYAPAVELVVGIDMATAHVRAVAADARGGIVASAEARLPSPTSPRPGWSEQDAGAWWPAVCAALRGLGDARRSVVALTVCATSGTVVALDEDGRPLGPALMYSDQRAVADAEAAQEAGARRWADLGLRIQPSFGLPKWAWLLREHPATARLAHASDVVVGRLVGRPVATDWGHALKSGYDPARGEWATEAMEALGIPASLLPDVSRPTEPAGPVGHEAAAATGLPPGCLVRLGTTDSCAAQLAAGADRPGRFVSVLGSTLVLKGASQDLVTDPAGAVYSHRHPDGWWLPGGASNVGAAVLHAEFDGRDLAALDASAAGHGPAGCVVYPLVGRGERFPFTDADAEGFSLGAATDEVDRYRALLEGVAYVERLGYERLTALGATVDGPVAVSGGGSRSRSWNSIRATVLGRPVVETPGATTALGACILASAGTLHADLTAATASMADQGEPVEPVENERDALEESYRRFVGAVAERGWSAPGGGNR